METVSISGPFIYLSLSLEMLAILLHQLSTQSRNFYFKSSDLRMLGGWQLAHKGLQSLESANS
jgi:hypothetical protein